MDYSRLVKKFDKSGLLEITRAFPAQFGHAIAQSYSWNSPGLKKKYSGVIAQGMGGSAIGALFARDALKNELKIPFAVNRNYSLPAFAKKSWLGLFVSYSGNTEETLSGFAEAKRKKMKTACISSGGKLAQKCSNPLILPSGFPPRTILPSSFVAIIAALEKAGLVKKKKELKKTAGFLEKNALKAEKQGMGLAEFLKGKNPVIYAPERLGSAAQRLHAQFAENSKAFSHWNVFPELNHNEIVGWKPLEKKLGFVFLRGKKESEKERKRIDFTKELALKKSKCIEIRAKGKTELEKLFYLALAGDFASFYLAMLYGVDPTPVENIEKLKDCLK